MIKKLGNGKGTRFWLDTWVGGSTLRQQFPRLFSISTHKESCIDQVGEWGAAGWEWKLEWRRSLFVWEEELLTTLMNLIETIILSHQNDSWKCNIGGDGEYNVKDGYGFLSDNFLPQLEISQDCRRNLRWIWYSFAPLKVIIFSWQVLLQRLPTRMNLIKRGLLAPPSTPCCVFCMLVEETESHLFSCCPVAVDVWTAINAWLGVSTAVPCNLSLSFQSFGFPFKCKVRTKGINLIWQTVLWSIWLARNSLIFDGVRLHVTDIVEAIKYRSLKWFLARKVGVVHLSYEWEKYPLECLLR
jgi:hypothetical protein